MDVARRQDETDDELRIRVKKIRLTRDLKYLLYQLGIKAAKQPDIFINFTREMRIHKPGVYTRIFNVQS